MDTTKLKEDAARLAKEAGNVVLTGLVVGVILAPFAFFGRMAVNAANGE
jgi:hypothetical protein